MNNSLAEVHPEIVSEWSEKNLPWKPDEVNAKSRKNVWWIKNQPTKPKPCELFYVLSFQIKEAREPLRTRRKPGGF